jgi:hypothetical protein
MSRGQLAAVAGAVAMVALAGCGGAGTVRTATGGTPRPAAGPAASTTVDAPVPAAGAVLVVSDTDPQNGSVPVMLLRDDGTVLGRDSVPAAQQWSVTAGPGGAYWVAGGRLHRLDTRGRSSDLGAVEPDQNGHVAVAPDGRSWVYTTSTPTPDGVRTNRLWRGGAGQPSRLLAERVSDPMHPTPGMPTSWVYSLKSWTPAGVLAVREPSGGCGCIAFDMETVSGNALLVDPETGAGTTLPTDRSCPLSGAAADATVVCFHSAASSGADELRVLGRGGATRRFSLSGTTTAGDARFDPSGTTLAYATAPSSAGCGEWQAQTTLRVLDLSSGDAHALGPAGLQPVAWLSDGRVAATMMRGTTDVAVVSVDAHTGALRTLMDGHTIYVVGATA